MTHTVIFWKETQHTTSYEIDCGRSKQRSFIVSGAKGIALSPPLPQLTMELHFTTHYQGYRIRSVKKNTTKEPFPVPSCLASRPYFPLQALMRDRLPLSVKHARSLHSKTIFLDERHFIECHAQEWNLFYVGVKHGPQSTAFYFVSLPQKSDMDIRECRNGSKWVFVGECRASMIRMDMEEMMYPILLPWTASKRPECNYYCNIHVYMEEIFDRKWKRDKPKERLDGR
jgi:hypothetical protein